MGAGSCWPGMGFVVRRELVFVHYAEEFFGDGRRSFVWA